ncbi:MAG: flippase-like domain-containing protein [Chromatiales bacterium]|nr:flippase-like domain-containing protein [Gammaproteobacteria bacterium]MCP5353011.1 flippase-like domain-containing protein [Chromatiales bacterium]
MGSSTRQFLTTSIAIGISVLFCVLAFRGVSWADTWAALRGANWLWFAAGALIGLSGFAARAAGWRILLLPHARIPATRLFSPVAIGYMANNLLPARLGEFARAYVVGKRDPVSKTAAFGSIVVERLLDAFALLSVMLAITLVLPYPEWVKDAALLLLIAMFGLALVLIVLRRSEDLRTRLVHRWLTPYAPRLANHLLWYMNTFLGGAGRPHELMLLLGLIFWIYLRWTLEAGMYLLTFYALGLDAVLPPHAAVFVMVVVNIACMVPQAPGYIGAVQFATVESLALFNIDSGTAIAYSLLVHVAFFVPITVVGLIYLVVGGFSLTRLRDPDPAEQAST